MTRGPSPTDADLLMRLPALRAYINRVGAVQKSFRKYVIEADGEPAYGIMRKVAATIAITAENQLKVFDKEGAYKPTADEVAAIETELTTAELPKSIPVNRFGIDELRRQIGGNPTLFEFRQQRGDGCVFVQQRIYRDSGDKADLPWSFWSDGQWRRMEPDGALPLFGLDQIQTGKPIMIHEGAKAASHVLQLINDPEALTVHPWRAELARYSHLGWPGGAPNAHRVDWDPIKKLPEHRRVVLVCDNDQGGVDAVTEISRRLRRPLVAIIFNNEFLQTFDLAEFMAAT